jgi:general secretion pathway protein K
MQRHASTKATPGNNCIEGGTDHAHPVMAGEGPPSTAFLRAAAKSWTPTGACHRSLDPVVGMTGEIARRATSRFAHWWASPNIGPANAARREQGFALLIVLWTLPLLLLLVTQMVAIARSEALIAANLRSAIEPESRADGAIYAAAFHLLDRSEMHWEPDGTTHDLTVSGGTVLVRVTDEANKVNLNTASVDLLRALLMGVGADRATAGGLAAAIVDWRMESGLRVSTAKAQEYRAAGVGYLPPEKPFRSIDELALVLGMTPELLARVSPHLTLYSTYGPGRASTDPAARGAIMLLRQQGGVLPYEFEANGVRVVEVTATAAGTNGATFTRRAILRFDRSSKDRPCAILLWDH